jgi:hypothetical protein
MGPTAGSRDLAVNNMSQQAKLGIFPSLGLLKYRSTQRHDAQVGNVNRKIAPQGTFAVAHNSPPCASTIEWQIDRPSPNPLGFVV